jgi:hypothetical protein
MKKTPSSPDELRPEYRFDYKKARLNRFAEGHIPSRAGSPERGAGIKPGASAPGKANKTS